MFKIQSKKKNVCLIKLDAMGDVLRTTPISRLFKNDELIWITENASVPLLRNNPFIKEIFPISAISGVSGIFFDELYNFDENTAACLLATSLKAGKKKGYGLKDGCYYPFDADSKYAYELSKNDELKFKLNKKTYQQIIFEMAGLQWKDEDYVFSYQSKNKMQYEVGINFLVGRKFPDKAWTRWKELAGMLSSVSIQRQFDTVEEYIDWIDSCQILVTGDSLGMHIALALKKKVIILMGPTSRNEIETYGRGTILTSQLSCSPCYKKNKCDINPSCMDLINPEKVYSEIIKIKEAIEEDACI